MVRKFLFLAGPSTLSVVLETVMEVINTLFIGRLGDATTMAALGLAHILLNLLAVIPIMGANTAIETFVSQSYGANDLRECGNYLNRGRVTVFFIYLPSIAVLFNTDSILIAIG